ncbi:hypothetical protein AAY473_014388 [Plecturocebus cupreus]
MGPARSLLLPVLKQLASSCACLPSPPFYEGSSAAGTLGGQGRQITRSRDRDHPSQHGETPSLLKNTKICWAWWCAPVVLATWEAEARELLEPNAQITPRLVNLESLGGTQESAFFGDRVLLCHSDWSTMAQSQLTATSASQAQVILPPQPPSSWDYRLPMRSDKSSCCCFEIGSHSVAQAGVQWHDLVLLGNMSWAQVVLPPQSPQYLGPQLYTIIPG